MRPDILHACHRLLRRKAAISQHRKGRTTCAYFLPGDTAIFYASTHRATIPPGSTAFCTRQNYVLAHLCRFSTYSWLTSWKHYQTAHRQPGYDAEYYFTGWNQDRIHLYPVRRPGTLDDEYRWVGLQQVTNELGYDGGAFFPGQQRSWSSALPVRKRTKRFYTKACWQKRSTTCQHGSICL